MSIGAEFIRFLWSYWAEAWAVRPIKPVYHGSVFSEPELKPHNDDSDYWMRTLTSSVVIIISHPTAACFIIIIIIARSATCILVTLSRCCHCTAASFLQTLTSICYYRLQNNRVLVNLSKAQKNMQNVNDYLYLADKYAELPLNLWNWRLKI